MFPRPHLHQPPPPKDQAFILGDGWTSERAALHLLRTYRISVKAWSKPSRGGVTVKHKDIDEVFKAWDPFIFFPPAYLLHLDPRPGTNRLVVPGQFPGGSRSSSRPTWKTEFKERHSTPSTTAPPPQSHRLSPSLHLVKAKDPPRHQHGWSSSSRTGTMSTSPSVAPSRSAPTTRRLLSSPTSGSTPTCYNLPTSAVVAATPSIQASVASASATPLPSSVAFVAPLITRSSTATTALEPARPSPAS